MNLRATLSPQTAVVISEPSPDIESPRTDATVLTSQPRTPEHRRFDWMDTHLPFAQVEY